MIKNIIALALPIVLLPISNAGASDFSGSYAGANISRNNSELAASPDKHTDYFGLSGGHNWDYGSAVLGVNGFYDDHTKAYSGHDYGVDGKLGLPNGNWMPYAKLGWIGSNPGDRLHGGLGVEYKLSTNWHATGEWTTDRKSSNGLEYKNNNFGIGLNYYFKAPKAAPVIPAVAPAPVVVHKEPELAPAPVVAPPPPPPPPAPVPQIKESWKIIKEQKPVTIEGANFDFDSAKLRPTADAKLQPVVEFASKYPEAGMNVHGHTDSIGTHAYNQKLSERRAKSVKAYLVKHGIDASRITTKGFGETEHIADNNTAEGRAKNRRVEIHYTIIEEKKIRVTE